MTDQQKIITVLRAARGADFRQETVDAKGIRQG